jgi:hypothetical protein
MRMQLAASCTPSGHPFTKSHFSHYSRALMHQFCAQLYTTADTFRARGIPCDGLHIDVDFADRYKSFTHDPVAFPDVTEFFENLDGKVRASMHA